MKTNIINSFKEIDLSSYKMPIITIYKNTSDFPNRFAARLFNFSEPQSYIAIKDTLEDARNTIPLNMVRLGRHDNDDPHIVEVWI